MPWASYTLTKVHLILVYFYCTLLCYLLFVFVSCHCFLLSNCTVLNCVALAATNELKGNGKETKCVLFDLYPFFRFSYQLLSLHASSLLSPSLLAHSLFLDIHPLSTSLFPKNLHALFLSLFILNTLTPHLLFILYITTHHNTSHHIRWSW